MDISTLPQPPSLKKTLGPSFILLGLALGSGELILWPYLSANYGLGLLWGGLLGLTFQYFLNTEIIRYALASGESVFVGFRRLNRIWPFWFILSTFIPWALPGFSSASAQIFAHLFGFSHPTFLAIFLLIFTGLILSFGKTLYRTMEIFQVLIISLSFPLLLYFVFRFVHLSDWFDLGRGLLGFGNNWWLFPSGLAMGSFLSAFAYSGAGGNLNLTQSYNIKEKGFGMGAYSGHITSLSSSAKTSLEGHLLADNRLNRSRWRRWWRLATKEHFLVFWLLGFLTIVFLALLSKVLVYGHASNTSIDFLYQEAEAISYRIGSIFSFLFLFMAGSMLFSTQVGILESSSRIISENTFLSSDKLWHRPVNLSLGFYLALWSQIGLGIILLLLGIKEPRSLLTLGAILNAVAIMLAFPLILVLNLRSLPSFAKTSLFRRFVILIAFLFFFFFVIFTFKQNLLN